MHNNIGILSLKNELNDLSSQLISISRVNLFKVDIRQRIICFFYLEAFFLKMYIFEAVAFFIAS